MKISIKKYQELYDINQMECTMEDKASLLVQCLTGKNEEQVKNMSKKRLKMHSLSLLNIAHKVSSKQ